MNCIIFIGTQKSGSSFDALTVAKSMGYYTVLMTNMQSHIDRKADFSNVDTIMYCNLHDIELIKEKIDALDKSLEMSAIVSFMEGHCRTASLLAKEYGLKYFTTEAIEIMLNKLETRKACAPYSAYFHEVTEKDDLGKLDIESKCPLILKRPMSTGSKGVVRINSYADYENELSNNSTMPMLIEEYLEGPQYLVEALVIKGVSYIAAIVKQEISYSHRYIVTGYEMIHDDCDELMKSLKDATQDIVELIGMITGPCHFEFRYVKEQWKLIEANPRISGGAMNLLINEAYGINLVKETLKLALDQEPDLQIKFKKEIFAQYIIMKKEGILLKVTGRNKAQRCKGVLYVYIKPRKGQLLIPPLSMGHRYAFVIATGSTANEARNNAKHAACHIQFYLRDIDAETLEKLTSNQKQLLDEFYKIRLEQYTSM